MEMKDLREYFKVGETVWLRDDLKIEDYCVDDGVLLVEDMIPHLGKSFIIHGVFKENVRYYSGVSYWFLSEQMIDWDKTFPNEYKSTSDLTVKFARMNESVIIPSKNLEDAGYDLYANFEQESIIINQNEVVVVPTGLKSAYAHTHMVMVKERGSTGFIAMSTKAGVFDSGFRNEWKVLINNTNTKPILITKETNESTLEILKDDYIVYPYSKAIAQFLFLPVPVVEIEVVDESEIDSIDSIRGTGMLGSSGK